MYTPAALFIFGSIFIVSGTASSPERMEFRGGPLTYYISPISTNFFAARDHCIEYNADLATFESLAELEAVSKYLIDHGFNSEANDLFWVSYWDLGRPQGLFRSIATGKLMTTSGWIVGQPDNYGGSEHCVQIVKRHGKYGMNDSNCNSSFRALCQQRM